MPREKFPNRYPCTTVNIPHGYQNRHQPDIYAITFAELPSGKIGEIWLGTINGHAKLINDDMPDTCISTSRGLQFGDTVGQLAKSARRDKRGKPLGWLGSVVDGLKKEPLDG